jgi:hypothetical protein
MINILSLATGYGSMNLIPTLIGSRVNGVLAFYERWKLMKVILKPISININCMGISDDPLDGSGDITTINEILELRCSRYLNQVTGTGTVSAPGTDTDELQWNPIDPLKWYYTQLEGAGDIRLVAPGNVVFFNTTATAQSSSFVLYYSILGEGSRNVSS